MTVAGNVSASGRGGTVGEEPCRDRGVVRGGESLLLAPLVLLKLLVAAGGDGGADCRTCACSASASLTCSAALEPGPGTADGIAEDADALLPFRGASPVRAREKLLRRDSDCGCAKDGDAWAEDEEEEDLPSSDGALAG